MHDLAKSTEANVKHIDDGHRVTSAYSNVISSSSSGYRVLEVFYCQTDTLARKRVQTID